MDPRNLALLDRLPVPFNTEGGLTPNMTGPTVAATAGFRKVLVSVLDALADQAREVERPDWLIWGAMDYLETDQPAPADPTCFHGAPDPVDLQDEYDQADECYRLGWRAPSRVVKPPGSRSEPPQGES